MLLDGHRQPLHEQLLALAREHVALQVAVLAIERLVDRPARTGGIHRARHTPGEVADTPQGDRPVLWMTARVLVLVVECRIVGLVPALGAADRAVVAQGNPPGPVIRAG